MRPVYVPLSLSSLLSIFLSLSVTCWHFWIIAYYEHHDALYIDWFTNSKRVREKAYHA